MKTCVRCQVSKTEDAFYRKGDKLRAWCKDCCKVHTKDRKEYHRDYYVNNRDKSRGWHLKRYYGITLEQYNDLLDKQNNKCAVCDKLQSDEGRSFSVDHNHKTGEIRGLLCTYCNHRVVGRHTDGNLLRRIASYVEQGTGLFVPPKKKRKKKRGRK